METSVPIMGLAPRLGVHVVLVQYALGHLTSKVVVPTAADLSRHFEIAPDDHLQKPLREANQPFAAWRFR